MTLQIYTARISTRDPDRFDITRGSGGAAGAPFAPSNDILQPVLAKRRRAEALYQQAKRLDQEHLGARQQVNLLPMDAATLEFVTSLMMEAEFIENEAWRSYVPLYLAEMRASYVSHRAAWDALLARPRVVLTCYCAACLGQPLHCHRVLLAERCLVPCGAIYLGELAA